MKEKEAEGEMERNDDRKSNEKDTEILAHKFQI